MRIKNKLSIVLSFMIVLSVMLQGIFIPAYAAGLNAYDINHSGLYDSSSNTHANFGKDARGFKGAQAKSWVMFAQMDFGEVGPYKVELENRTPDGYCTSTVQIMLDDPASEPIAIVPITPNEDWSAAMTTNEAWITKEITGKHDVYLYITDHTFNSGNLTFYEKVTDQFAYEKYTQGAGFTDVEDESLKRTLDMLGGLGIITVPEDGLYKPTLPATRAEFAQSIYRMFVEAPSEEDLQKQQTDAETTISTKFEDVTGDSAYAEAIKYLSEQGIMNGVSDTQFKPDSFITYLDAVTVMVRILGFKTLAEEAGGYPNGYIKMATKEKLVSGSISTDEYISREDMAYLLANTLEADYLDADSFTADGYTHFKRRDGILSITQDTYMASGKVEGSPVTYLNKPNSELEFNQVIIGGTKYYVGDTNVSAMIGMEVDYFYQDVDGKLTLRAVVPADNTEIVELSSSADEITTLSNSKIVYTKAGEDDEETFKINGDTSIIYNGVAAHTNLEGMLDSKDAFKGFISIAENYDGSAVIMIDEYVDIEIESVDTDAQTVTVLKNSKETENLIIDLDGKENYVIMKDEIGEDMTIDQLKSGDMLTVLQSKNDGKKLVRVYPAGNTITGTIDKIDEDGNVYIDGKKYVFSNRYDGLIEVGMQRTFYLNAYGDVFKAESIAGIPQVGLYWGCAYSDDGLEENGEIKIMTTSAKTQVFKFGKNTTIDGINVATAKEVAKGTTGWSGLEALALETPIRYTVNADGVVRMIDTPYVPEEKEKILPTKVTDDPNNTLIQLPIPSKSVDGNLHYNGAGGFLTIKDASSGTDFLSPTYYCPSTATAFAFYVNITDTTAGSGERERSCIAGKMPSIIQSGYVANAAYSTIANLREADLVIDNNKSTDYEGDQPVVVERVTTKLDSNGELVYILKGYSTTGEVEYTLSEDFLNSVYSSSSPVEMRTIFTGENGVKTGDVLKMRTLSKKDAKKIEMIPFFAYGQPSRTFIDINGAEKTFKATLSTSAREYTTSTKYEPGYRYGTVLERNDKYMIINVGTAAVPEEELIPISGALVLEVYKTDRGEFIKNGVGSSAIEKGDEVFIYMYSSAVKMVVIYDDGVEE